MFRWLMQAYLALGGTVEALIDDADLDWQPDRQARFTLSNVLDAVAPTNLPLTNPTVLKETLDRGGANLVHGGRRMVRDLSKGRLPAMVDTSKFEVGGNLALTAGSVVLRTDVCELIHYRPTTEQVYETPIVIVPPTINKYYVLDLAPAAASSSTVSARATRCSWSRGATPTGSTATSTSTPTRRRCSRHGRRRQRSRATRRRT